MTMEALSQNVENAIAQYERACEQEEELREKIETLRDSSQASFSEEYPNQREDLEEMRETALQYQYQLQRVQAAKAQALEYLQSTRSELANVIKSLQEKLPKFDQSISAFEQMASNPFGSSAAAKLPQLRASRAEYQRNLNDAYTLVERIDSILNGGGNSPQRVLRKG